MAITMTPAARARRDREADHEIEVKANADYIHAAAARDRAWIALTDRIRLHLRDSNGERVNLRRRKLLLRNLVALDQFEPAVVQAVWLSELG